MSTYTYFSKYFLWNNVSKKKLLESEGGRPGDYDRIIIFMVTPIRTRRRSNNVHKREESTILTWLSLILVSERVYIFLWRQLAPSCQLNKHGKKQQDIFFSLTHTFYFSYSVARLLFLIFSLFSFASIQWCTINIGVTESATGIRRAQVWWCAGGDGEALLSSPRLQSIQFFPRWTIFFFQSQKKIKIKIEWHRIKREISVFLFQWENQFIEAFIYFFPLSSSFSLFTQPSGLLLLLQDDNYPFSN